jgi:hypothetical protein
MLQAMSLLLYLLLSTASAFSFSGSGFQTVPTRTSTSLPALFGLGAPPAQKAGTPYCDVFSSVVVQQSCSRSCTAVKHNMLFAHSDTTE